MIYFNDCYYICDNFNISIDIKIQTLNKISFFITKLVNATKIFTRLLKWKQRKCQKMFSNNNVKRFFEFNIFMNTIIAKQWIVEIDNIITRNNSINITLIEFSNEKKIRKKFEKNYIELL